MDREEVADLLLERRRDALAERRRSPRASVVPRRRVQRVDLLGRERRALPERQQPGGVEDLVAVGVADPGDERLVLQQVLQLARMAPDPLPPDVERQRRDRRRPGPSSSSVRPGTAAVDAGRQQVDLAHLRRVAVADLDGGVVGRHPVGAARPARRLRAAARARPEAEDDRRLRRQLRRRARRAGSGRSASG